MGDFQDYRKCLPSLISLSQALEKIPTIGKKSALKLAYFLAYEDKITGESISQILKTSIANVSSCKFCNALCEGDLCAVCTDMRRDNDKLCVVAHFKDIFTIEETGRFMGRYFVLVGDAKINITKLSEQVERFGVSELIFAFSPTLANDALILFIEDKLQGLDLHFTKIAQGVPTGIGFENVDTLSLTRAFDGRTRI